MLSSCARDVVVLTGDISGTVKAYVGGQLIDNCKVTLSPSGESVSTDASGNFSFKNLTPGNYSLSFTNLSFSNSYT